MSEPIKPTVGRIVYWYEIKPVAGGFATLGPHAAIITAVHSDNCVNLAVHNQNGSGTFGRTSVKLLAPSEPRPFYDNIEHWCEWMPYQIAQANAAVHAEMLKLVARNQCAGMPHDEVIDVRSDRGSTRIYFRSIDSTVHFTGSEVVLVRLLSMFSRRLRARIAVESNGDIAKAIYNQLSRQGDVWATLDAPPETNASNSPRAG